MPKRKAEGYIVQNATNPSYKKSRITPTNLLSKFSDELLLRVLSNVSILDLTVCQRVSRRLERIAGDSQLWRTAYYDRFVRPRYQQRPKSRRSVIPSRLTKWLDEGRLVARGTATNWKRQYKLRHKWSKGSCGFNEIPVPTRSPTPPLLAKLHDGIIYTADSNIGLRAWSYREDRNLLASYSLSLKVVKARAPTALAVDLSNGHHDRQGLVLGFDDGSFGIYCYDKEAQQFHHLCTHSTPSSGALAALAYTSPYILSMSDTQNLSLYQREEAQAGKVIDPPRKLTSLKSHTVWTPLSLSLRVTEANIVAAIAYCLPTFNSGWSAGVQELHLSMDGSIIYSRLASALGREFSLVNNLANLTAIPSKPTSLSYSHPYLLVSHSDNTLALYIVTSSKDSLSVGPSKRLWGHTSGVFGAHVGRRGKAVSVSTRGNEIRVWELEGSNLVKVGSEQYEDLSVQITPEKSTRIHGSLPYTDLARTNDQVAMWKEEGYLDITKAYVGFDEESVIVLREREQGGGQALAVYDFS